MGEGGGRSREADESIHAAVDILETQPESRELCLAYAGMAMVCMNADDIEGTFKYGPMAMSLAERFGDTESLVHVLNTVGTMEMLTGDLIVGREKLERSLELAMEAGFDEHVGRGGVVHSTNRSTTAAVTPATAAAATTRPAASRRCSSASTATVTTNAATPLPASAQLSPIAGASVLKPLAWVTLSVKFQLSHPPKVVRPTTAKRPCSRAQGSESTATVDAAPASAP